MFAPSKREQDERNLRFEFDSRQINQFELKTIRLNTIEYVKPVDVTHSYFD
jgi:hypothetical protein